MASSRSISESATRGRSRTPALVLAKKAKAVRCQSKRYRKFPHSFYSGAVTWRNKKDAYELNEKRFWYQNSWILPLPYLSLGKRKFFFTKLTMCGFFVLQPNQSLEGRGEVNVQTGPQNYMWAHILQLNISLAWKRMNEKQSSGFPLNTYLCLLAFPFWKSLSMFSLEHIFLYFSPHV